MQQQQQLDIQQQQADQQQQSAMLAQMASLYGMSTSQQMQPLQMQAAQLANDRSAMDLQHMPDIYGLQQRTGESNLQTAEQARMLNANVDQRAGEMHDPALRNTNASAGVNEFNLSHMDENLAMDRLLQNSSLDTQALNRLMVSADESRKGGLFPFQQQNANLSNRLLNTDVDTAALQLQFLPDELKQRIALGQHAMRNGELQNDILQSKANWADTNAGQEWAHNNAQIANSRAVTSRIMNPMAEFNAKNQQDVWNIFDNPADRIPMEDQNVTALKAEILKARGFDPQGRPTFQKQLK